MKICILVLVILISPIELRLRNDDDIYQLDDILNKPYERHRNRPSNQRYDEDEDNDDDNDDGEEFIPSLPEHKKPHSSRKKVFLSDEDEPEESTKSTESDSSSTCLDKYAMRSEQLVKVKELKNGAHLIRYVLLDKRILSSSLTVKEHCMITCCSEKICDLAMISEQPTHNGYKCYLFACNGSCPLASHQDYTIMFPKKDPAYFTKSATTRTEEKAISTTPNVDVSKPKSFFRDTSVIIFLIFGLVSTIVLFVFLVRHWLESKKRGRRLKNYTVDADYLINGLYL